MNQILKVGMDITKNQFIYTMMVKKNKHDQNGPKSCRIRECVTCDRMNRLWAHIPTVINDHNQVPLGKPVTSFFLKINRDHSVPVPAQAIDKISLKMTLFPIDTDPRLFSRNVVLFHRRGCRRSRDKVGSL